MISILIPTYNYNVYNLVSTVQKQIELTGLDYEIICLDDASTLIFLENEKINDLPHSSYKKLEINIGRSRIRNLLAQKANYSWVLFMDCDTFPKNSSFIKNYVQSINQNIHEVYYGGIDYKKERPDKDELLRWVYGQKRESIAVSVREKNPYRTTLVSNLVIKKKILLSYPFNSSINDYGFEDLVFLLELKKNKIKICHIENPTYHLNLEKSVIFLEKNLKAVKNLNYLIKNQIIAPNETSLSNAYSILLYLKLDNFVSFCFNFFKVKMKKNLLSKNPSLLVFDLYKLGYICSLNYH